MHFSQTTSFSCILGRPVKRTARVQLGLNQDYKPETLQQKHLQCSAVPVECETLKSGRDDGRDGTTDDGRRPWKDRREG